MGIPDHLTCLLRNLYAGQEATVRTGHGTTDWFQIGKVHQLLLGGKVMTSLDSVLKSRDIILPTKVHLVKAMVFPVVMYGCESWTIKKLSAKELMLLNCGVEEDSWDPLDCKEIQPVHPKGDQSWLFIGRTDAEAETPILWPPDAKSFFMEKILILGKIEGGRRMG